MKSSFRAKRAQVLQLERDLEAATTECDRERDSVERYHRWRLEARLSHDLAVLTHDYACLKDMYREHHERWQERVRDAEKLLDTANKARRDLSAKLAVRRRELLFVESELIRARTSETYSLRHYEQHRRARVDGAANVVELRERLANEELDLVLQVRALDAADARIDETKGKLASAEQAVARFNASPVYGPVRINAEKALEQRNELELELLTQEARADRQYQELLMLVEYVVDLGKQVDSIAVTK